MSDYLEISVGTKIILNKPPSFGSKAVIFKVCYLDYGSIVCSDMKGREHIISKKRYEECGGRIYDKEKEYLRKQNKMLRKQVESLVKETLKPDYQERVHEWAQACFGEDTAKDKTERNHRFLEEAVEKELKNIWNSIDKIRHKQANKPKFSPLPQ